MQTMRIDMYVCISAFFFVYKDGRFSDRKKITLTKKADRYTINFVQSSDRGAATKSNNPAKGNAAEGIQVPGPSENICRTVAEGQRRAIMNQKMFLGYFCESWQPYHDSFLFQSKKVLPQ